MTERERLLEKVKRVQALAERGVDGEKDSAAALLDRLMKQYGISEAEIAEERREIAWFRFKTPLERKLLNQVIYTVTGRIPYGCVDIQAGQESRSGLNAPRRSGWKSKSVLNFTTPHCNRNLNGSIRRSCTRTAYSRRIQ